MFHTRKELCRQLSATCPQKRPPFYFYNDSQKLTDFNDFWCVKCWENLTSTACTCAHLFWDNVNNLKYVWIILLKNIFFGFHKVKWLQYTGEVGKCQMYELLMTNFLRFYHTKISSKLFIFDKVIWKIKGWTIFGTQYRKEQVAQLWQRDCKARLMILRGGSIWGWS